MKQNITNRVGLGLILALVLSACSSPPILTETEQRHQPAVTGLDARLLDLGERLDGFGGLFFDDEGDLNIYLTGAATAGLSAQALEQQRAQVKGAVTAVFGDDFLERGAGRPRDGESPLGSQSTSSPAGVKILDGRYDVKQLAGWRDSLDSLLGRDGVVLTDLDEARNRVRVGVEAGTPRDEIEAELTELGVPLEGVLIEETEPYSAMSHTVRGRFRPNLGGTQVSFRDLSAVGWLCTLGFNAYRAGVRGFVTNSHCTGSMGAVDWTSYYQSTLTGANYVGFETVDPPFFPCPRVTSRRCRYSDSAFVRYTSTASSSFGRIARTTGWWGSLAIDHGNPSFLIVSEPATTIAGSFLEKVGRTTGWTYGQVTATCVTANMNGTNNTFLCQDIVSRSGGNPIVRSGDSGSPVFKWSYNTAELNGILWGSNGDGSNFIFSSLGNIERDLGNLITYFN